MLALIHNSEALRASTLIERDPGRIVLLPESAGRMVVDYSKALEERVMIGRYDYARPDITASKFPIVGEGIVEFEFGYYLPRLRMPSEGVEKRIHLIDHANPWMSARIEHVLVHGAMFPDVQRSKRVEGIIGLGSSAQLNDARLVPILSGVGAQRHLSLTNWAWEWRLGYVFLAVRPVRAF